MERRSFITSLMAAAAAIASNPQAHAAQASLADDAATAGAPATVHILVQAGVPHARALADELARSLHGAGIAHTLRSERALLDPARVAALLPHESGAALIGITDEACAVVMQAVAASRGQACVRHRSQRVAATPLASFVIRL